MDFFVTKALSPPPKTDIDEWDRHVKSMPINVRPMSMQPCLFGTPLPTIVARPSLPLAAICYTT